MEQRVSGLFVRAARAPQDEPETPTHAKVAELFTANWRVVPPPSDGDAADAARPLTERLDALLALKEAGRVRAEAFLAELEAFRAHLDDNLLAVHAEIDAAYYQVRHSELGHLMCDEHRAARLAQRAEQLKRDAEHVTAEYRGAVNEHIAEVDRHAAAATSAISALQRLREMHGVYTRVWTDATARLLALENLAARLNEFQSSFAPRKLSTKPRVNAVPFLSAVQPLSVYTEPHAKIALTSVWHNRLCPREATPLRAPAADGLRVVGETLDGRLIWAGESMLLVEDDFCVAWDRPLRDFQVDARGLVWARGDDVLCCFFFSIGYARIFTMALPEQAAGVHLPPSGLVLYEQTDGLLVGLLVDTDRDLHLCGLCNADPCCGEPVPAGARRCLGPPTSSGCISAVALAAWPDSCGAVDAVRNSRIVRTDRVHQHPLVQQHAWARAAAQHVNDAHWPGVHIEQVTHCTLGALALWIAQTRGIGKSWLMREDVLAVPQRDGSTVWYTTCGEDLGQPVGGESSDLEAICGAEWPYVHERRMPRGGGTLSSRENLAGTTRLSGGRALSEECGTIAAPVFEDIVC